MTISPERDERRIQLALSYLTTAAKILKDEKCPKVLAKVRLAISSAKGAIRNAGYQDSRRERQKRAAAR